MKALTLHQTSGVGGDYERDRRTSTGGDQYTSPMLFSGSNSGPISSNGGIAGLGNIDATVNHYELPNLA
jgi:hypothetical protein